MQAPTTDSQGRRTLLKFARKTKEQYVISEEDGKPSGWRADYVNGKWLIDEKIKAPRKAKAKAKPKSKSKAKSKVSAGK